MDRRPRLLWYAGCGRYPLWPRQPFRRSVRHLYCLQYVCSCHAEYGQDVLHQHRGHHHPHWRRPGLQPRAYLIEAEDIYVGYRYYETRYYDSVAGTGNATSPVGAYGSDTEWNYDNEVTYGFGYGLSYTEFTYEFQGEPTFDITVDPETGAPNAYATFNVKVTNVGDVAGKTPVQIYGQAPYTPGGIEKSAIQLLNFEKTEILEPGASEVVPVKVDLQYIASYDENYDNGDGTTGTYIMDPGTYYFSVGNGAHDALTTSWPPRRWTPN